MAIQSNDTPLKRGAKAILGTLKQGAQDFGQRISNIRQGIQDIQASTSQRTQGGSGVQGSISPKMDASGTGAQTQTSSPTELGGTLAKELQATQPVKTDVVQSQVDRGKLGNFAISTPSTYTDTTGINPTKGGSVAYAQDKSGNIFSKDMGTGEVTPLQNGITQSINKPLTPSEQAGQSRFEQEHARWQQYKDEKAKTQERAFYQNLIANAGAGSSTGRTVNLGMIQQGTKGLQDIRGGDITSQGQQLQAETGRLGYNSAARTAQEKAALDAQGNQIQGFKAQSEAQGRQQANIVAGEKAIEEARQNADSPYSLYIKAKRLGTEPSRESTYRYFGNILGDLETPEEKIAALSNAGIPEQTIQELAQTF